MKITIKVLVCIVTFFLAVGFFSIILNHKNVEMTVDITPASYPTVSVQYAEVILNRLASDSFPDTLEGVIFAPGQFRSIEFLKDAEPIQAQYMAIEKAMYGPYILPEEVVHFATYKTTDYCWGQIGGHYFCYDWDYSGE